MRSCGTITAWQLRTVDLADDLQRKAGGDCASAITRAGFLLQTVAHKIWI